MYHAKVLCHAMTTAELGGPQPRPDDCGQRDDIIDILAPTSRPIGDTFVVSSHALTALQVAIISYRLRRWRGWLPCRRRTLTAKGTALATRGSVDATCLRRSADQSMVRARARADAR